MVSIIARASGRHCGAGMGWLGGDGFILFECEHQGRALATQAQLLHWTHRHNEPHPRGTRMITMRKSCRPRLCRPRLAEVLPQLLVRRLPRPARTWASGNLRVINEDRIAPGTGFGTHGHRDMEIISYVLEGALAHKDSMGNGAGDPARRRAAHERRAAACSTASSTSAPTQTTHFLQIWIEPDRAGIAPGYEQKRFDDADKRGRLRLVASPDGATARCACTPTRRSMPACSMARNRRTAAGPGGGALRARGARRRSGQRPAAGGGRRGAARRSPAARAWPTATAPRCWCSISPRESR